MTRILDGKWLAGQFHDYILEQVKELASVGRRPPGLGVILVGDNPASKAYVRNKEKVAKKRCGFETFDKFLSTEASFEDVKSAIVEFNQDENIDGILLQLPLPKHLEANQLLDLIDPAKDADGLHPLSQGLLLRGGGKLRPCTPLGVMALIDLAFELRINEELEKISLPLPKVDLSGGNAVVIGRSILVGKPVASMLLERNATVTQVHSKTKNIEEACKNADILIAAVGREHLVKPDWVKDGAIVIDVGINRTKAGKLTGDVEFETVKEKTEAITPVPGGVGPMTIAMLMLNTLKAYQLRSKLV